jgi:hypothetical protein
MRYFDCIGDIFGEKKHDVTNYSSYNDSTLKKRNNVGTYSK